MMAKGFKTFQKLTEKAYQLGAPKERVIDGEKHPVHIRTTPVMWGIPTDELGFSRFWTRFVRTANIMPWDGFAFSDGTYLEKARNTIHSGFVKSSYPLLMMLDSDILFPPDTLDKLIAHHLPMVGGWYKDKKADDHHPTVYDYVEDQEGVSVFRHRTEAGTGLEKVDAMGAGCWLMTHEVACALGEEPYGKNIAGGGEDMKLCRRLMELNIPLHVDWSINCAHWGVGFY